MKRIIVPLAAVWIAVMLLEIVLPVKDHGEHAWWRSFPGFYGIYGALGCSGIIVVAKGLGRLLLRAEPDPDTEERAPIDPAGMEEAR